MSDDENPSKSGNPSEEPVWTYRGYKLSPSQFTTAMVHLFRAEVQRANVWRQRLDTTTNWAVIATGAALSFAFTQQNSQHMVILLNILLVTLFLIIEARRYRYYELWSYRVRLMETDFFASMLVPPFHPSPDWAEALSEHLLQPHFSISLSEAVGRRLRRNYLWIYAVLGVAWVAKIWLLPPVVRTIDAAIGRATIGVIPGIWVILTVLGFYVLLILFSVATVGLQQSSGEVLPRYAGLAESIQTAASIMSHGPKALRPWYRPTQRRQQLLTFIITDQAEKVASRIMEDMNRGVTSLSGTGMFTRSPHPVLICALTVTEVPQLRHLVEEEDPEAFVIVSPAQEIFGEGFMPLVEEE